MPVINDTTTATPTLTEGTGIVDGTSKSTLFVLRDASPADSQIDALIQAGTKHLDNLSAETIAWVSQNGVAVITRAAKRRAEYVASLDAVTANCAQYRAEHPEMFAQGVKADLPSMFNNKRSLAILVEVFNTESDSNGQPLDTPVLRMVHDCCVRHSTRLDGKVTADMNKVGIPHFTRMYAKTTGWLNASLSSLD